MTAYENPWKSRGWVMGKDGLGPEHPDADPNCKNCSGHGVVDAGDYWAFFVTCECVAAKKEGAK